MSKSTIVITIADSNSLCTFAITKGIISEMISGGIDSAQVCRRGKAVLTGTTEQIVAECERVFNLANSDGSESDESNPYYGHLIETSHGTIYEAGNSLPYTGDLIYSGETNTVYRIAHCSRVQTNANGMGNSMDVTLIEAGSPDDYTESAFADIIDCRVDLEEEIDYSEYEVRVSNDPSYYGSECDADDGDRIANAICELIEAEFPGIQTELWMDCSSSSSTTGPNQDTVDSIDEWIELNWTAAL
jgi:hypothetical protein